MYIFFSLVSSEKHLSNTSNKISSYKLNYFNKEINFVTQISENDMPSAEEILEKELFNYIINPKCQPPHKMNNDQKSPSFYNKFLKNNDSLYIHPNSFLQNIKNQDIFHIIEYTSKDGSQHEDYKLNYGQLYQFFYLMFKEIKTRLNAKSLDRATNEEKNKDYFPYVDCFRALYNINVYCNLFGKKHNNEIKFTNIRKIFWYAIYNVGFNIKEPKTNINSNDINSNNNSTAQPFSMNKLIDEINKVTSQTVGERSSNDPIIKFCKVNNKTYHLFAKHRELNALHSNKNNTTEHVQLLRELFNPKEVLKNNTQPNDKNTMIYYGAGGVSATALGITFLAAGGPVKSSKPNDEDSKSPEKKEDNPNKEYNLSGENNPNTIVDKDTINLSEALKN